MTRLFWSGSIPKWSVLGTNTITNAKLTPDKKDDLVYNITIDDIQNDQFRTLTLSKNILDYNLL
jgi:hypothetical protein